MWYASLEHICSPLSAFSSFFIIHKCKWSLLDLMLLRYLILQLHLFLTASVCPGRTELRHLLLSTLQMSSQNKSWVWFIHDILSIHWPFGERGQVARCACCFFTMCCYDKVFEKTTDEIDLLLVETVRPNKRNTEGTTKDCNSNMILYNEFSVSFLFSGRLPVSPGRCNTWWLS